MKKRYLKRWVEVVLIVIVFVSVLIMASETEKYFLISKLISMVTFSFSAILLLKYSKLGGE